MLLGFSILFHCYACIYSTWYPEYARHWLLAFECCVETHTLAIHHPIKYALASAPKASNSDHRAGAQWSRVPEMRVWGPACGLVCFGDSATVQSRGCSISTRALFFSERPSTAVWIMLARNSQYSKRSRSLRCKHFVTAWSFSLWSQYQFHMPEMRSRLINIIDQLPEDESRDLQHRASTQQCFALAILQPNKSRVVHEKISLKGRRNNDSFMLSYNLHHLYVRRLLIYLETDW